MISTLLMFAVIGVPQSEFSIKAATEAGTILGGGFQGHIYLEFPPPGERFEAANDLFVAVGCRGEMGLEIVRNPFHEPGQPTICHLLLFSKEGKLLRVVPTSRESKITEQAGDDLPRLRLGYANGFGRFIRIPLRDIGDPAPAFIQGVYLSTFLNGKRLAIETDDITDVETYRARMKRGIEGVTKLVAIPEIHSKNEESNTADKNTSNLSLSLFTSTKSAGPGDTLRCRARLVNYTDRDIFAHKNLFYGLIRDPPPSLDLLALDGTNHGNLKDHPEGRTFFPALCRIPPQAFIESIEQLRAGTTPGFGFIVNRPVFGRFQLRLSNVTVYTANTATSPTNDHLVEWPPDWATQKLAAPASNTVPYEVTP